VRVPGKPDNRESGSVPHRERGHWPRPAEELLGWTGFGLAVFAVTAQTVAHVVDVWILDRDVPALELNTNENPLNWLPAVMILIAGVSVFRLHRTRPGASILLAAAAILVFFAIDDALELHYGVPYWPIVYLPLFGIVGWTLWSLANASLPPTPHMLKAGLGLLIAAVLVDIIAPTLLERGGWDVGAWPHELKVVLKEGTQLAGWVLIAFGVIAANVRVSRDRTPPSPSRWGAPPASDRFRFIQRRS
jgi:hypothetical protein